MSTENISASIVSVVRYPVKSMMGEELSVADVNENGLLGDRACALIDNSTGKIASAKNPRKWARLFDCHANFVEPPRKGHPASSVDHAARWQQPNQRSAEHECDSFPLFRAGSYAGENRSRFSGP
jgi:uncharacterized protein YcbX